MASRTGMQTMVQLVEHICRLWVKFGPRITAVINASSLTSPQKAAAIAAAQGVVDACNLFLTFRNVFEP